MYFAEPLPVNGEKFHALEIFHDLVYISLTFKMNLLGCECTCTHQGRYHLNTVSETIDFAEFSVKFVH